MSTSTRHFTRHYLEMIAGMVIIGIPAEGALHLVGSSSLRLQDDAPAIALLGMATMMTIPTFGVIAVPATGVSDDFGALMGIEHAAMLPAMLVAMLLRYDEYAGCHEARPANA